MNLCLYYQAEIKRSECWFFVGILRSFEYIAFDRTIDLSTSTFEFFVPKEQEQNFLNFIKLFEGEDIVKNLQKLPNRLASSQEKLS